ncbi:MAG TPA: YhbY family RNA-binding protein [Rudaea sp.]
MLHGVMIPCNGLMRLVFVAFSGHLVSSPMSLTSSQKRYLRGLAHAIKPVIQIGNKGITNAVRAEFSLALDHHELLKVKLTGEDRAARAEQIANLGAGANAELVQSIGKTACFYRRNPDAPKIALPK